MAYTLTVLGTGSIQPYIFGSSSLRENIGASELVVRATTLWVFEELKAFGKHNVTEIDDISLKPTLDDKLRIEESAQGLTAEVIYAGGGNTVILFGGDHSEETARDFVYSWSCRILDKAPGLDVYAAHQPVEFGNGEMAKAVEDGMEALGKLRGKLAGNQPLLGLGVTAACSSTGLPANETHEDLDKRGSLANIANCSVNAKWRASKQAQERLRHMLDIGNFEWTDNLNVIGDLPGRGDSYVAVVHADGNGMGKRIILLNELCRWLKMADRAYIRVLRRLSKCLNETAETALNRTIEALKKEIGRQTLEGNIYYPTNEDGEACFPMRPVVFGGDDVTWVCAGPLALASAQRYLQELEDLEDDEALPGFESLLSTYGEIEDAEAQLAQFEKETGKKRPASNKPFACAGVAIVKTHYPFFQAYQVSEELAGSAKNYVRQVREDKLASAIDWHFTTTGLSAALDQIRAQEYTTARGDKLYARPLMLDADYSWRNWDNFLNLWQAFDKDWFDKRNKMMGLREALRQGPTAVSQYLKIKKVKLPPPSILPARTGAFEGIELNLNGGWVDVPGQTSHEESGCIYMDVVEVEKQFVELH